MSVCAVLLLVLFTCLLTYCLDALCFLFCHIVIARPNLSICHRPIDHGESCPYHVVSRSGYLLTSLDYLNNCLDVAAFAIYALCEFGFASLAGASGGAHAVD